MTLFRDHFFLFFSISVVGIIIAHLIINTILLNKHFHVIKVFYKHTYHQFHDSSFYV